MVRLWIWPRFTVEETSSAPRETEVPWLRTKSCLTSRESSPVGPAGRTSRSDSRTETSLETAILWPFCGHLMFVSCHVCTIFSWWLIDEYWWILTHDGNDDRSESIFWCFLLCWLHRRWAAWGLASSAEVAGCSFRGNGTKKGWRKTWELLITCWIYVESWTLSDPNRIWILDCTTGWHDPFFSCAGFMFLLKGAVDHLCRG